PGSGTSRRTEDAQHTFMDPCRHAPGGFVVDPGDVAVYGGMGKLPHDRLHLLDREGLERRSAAHRSLVGCEPFGGNAHPEIGLFGRCFGYVDSPARASTDVKKLAIRRIPNRAGQLVFERLQYVPSPTEPGCKVRVRQRAQFNLYGRLPFAIEGFDAVEILIRDLPSQTEPQHFIQW